jgi:hypothetical protein
MYVNGKCKPEVTGLTSEGRTQHMQMFNYEYLREYFNTLKEVEHKDKRERERITGPISPIHQSSACNMQTG